MAGERQFDHDEAVRLYNGGRGLSMQEIADQLGVTKPSVWRVIKVATKANGGVLPVHEEPADDGRFPESFAEMLELAERDLWTYYKTAKGVAKVQAFGAIKEMAKREREEQGGRLDAEPLVADVVIGVGSLSAERKRVILTAEQSRLRAEISAVDGALAGLEAAA